MNTTCRICQTPISPPPTGRPPLYCSTTCRRTAEYRVGRAQKRLKDLEDKAHQLRLQCAGPWADLRDGCTGLLPADELPMVEAEIRRLEGELVQ